MAATFAEPHVQCGDAPGNPHMGISATTCLTRTLTCRSGLGCVGTGRTVEQRWVESLGLASSTMSDGGDAIAGHRANFDFGFLPAELTSNHRTIASI